MVTSFHNTELSPAAQWLSLPVLPQLLGIYRFFSVRYALRNSALLTVASRAILEALIPNEAALRQKAHILHYGTDIPPRVTEEEKRSFRERMGWSPDTLVVIHVGRFFEQKNHFGLLKAFQRVLHEIPEAKLILIGVGPLASDVERYVREHDLVASVRMLGPQNNAAKLIATSDVLLFPSFWEGFGIVALEANASAVPVVGSDVVGINEAVENHQTGLLYDVTDTDAMAAGVVRILTDPVYAKQLGEAGRTRAERLFSIRASAERLLHLYRQVLQQPSHAYPSS